MTAFDASSTSSAQPVSGSAPPWKRAGRWLALLGLTAALSFLLGLYGLSLVPRSYGAFLRLLGGDRLVERAEVPAALLTVVLSVGVLVVAGFRLRQRTLRSVVVFFLVGALVLTANFALMAWVPAVLNGYLAMAAMAFWKVNGVAFGLVLGVLCATALAAAIIRPRAFRAWVIFSLTLAAILISTLVLVALFPLLLGGWDQLPVLLRPGWTDEAGGDLLVVTALFVILPAAVFYSLWRLQKRSGWWIAGGYLGVAPIFVYLAVDDPVVRRPMTMEEITPAFPGAEKSFEVLLRYGKNHPLGRNFNAGNHVWRKPFGVNQSFSPNEGEKWFNMLQAHREDLELDWVELAPAWAWWNELNAFDRIGDLTPTRYDAEIMAFQPVRTVSQHACAEASLQALAGHGDEAIATVLPVLQVGHKLQPSARTLLRFMIAVVVEKISLSTVGFILDRATISAATREQLQAALTTGDGVAGARRLMAMEYAFREGATAGKSLSGVMGYDVTSPFLRRIADVIGPFVYNPRATYNIYGDYVIESQEIAGNRQLERLGPLLQRFAQQDARPTFKNFMGKQLLLMSTPAYSKVVQSYWDAQDQRAALLSRVEKLAPR